MKNFKTRIGQVAVGLFLAVSFATLAYAVQGVLKASTYYSTASTLTGNLSRIAPTGNLSIEVLNTAISGTPSVTPTVQGIDSAGNAFDLCVGRAITSAASSVQVIQVGPALTATSGTVGTGTLVSCSAVVPDLVRVNMVNASGVGSHGVTSTIYYNTSP